MKTTSNYLTKIFCSLLIGGLLSCSKGGGDIVKPAEEDGLPPIRKNSMTILSPNVQDAGKTYTIWKSTYITSQGCPAGKRVLFDDLSSTVSEGIGYGMLAAAYMNDQSLLNDLLLYYNSFHDPYGLMHWKIDNTGTVIGANAATDADEDVALALIMAHKRWGSTSTLSYLDSAKKIIHLLMEHTIEKGTFVLKAGDAWGGSQTTNPSYFAPAYYKVFFEVTQDSSWLKVVDKSYEILELAMNQDNGLVPDWCKATGIVPAANVSWAQYGGVAYTYDACRTPWRIATDQLWYGEPRALSYCKKISQFVQTKGIRNLRDGYRLDGGVIGSAYAKNAFVGPFGCALLVDPSVKRDSVNLIYTQNISLSYNGYYNESVKLLSVIFQTGIFTKPN